MREPLTTEPLLARTRALTMVEAGLVAIFIRSRLTPATQTRSTRVAMGSTGFLRAPMAEQPGVVRTRVRTFTISLDWRLIQSTPLRSIHSTNILLAYTRARTVGEVGLKPTLGYRTVPSPHL